MIGIQQSGDSRSGLGTFLGVYVPTVLTILGVIMYLRFGWVTGQMGLTRTLVIVVLANIITLITTLSFSAIATNFRVGVGGAYYIISRSLGLEFGGAIGIPLFLSQVFSVTLYAFGLAESFQILWPELPVQPAAFVIVVLVGALAFRGASLALRAQIPILVLIGLSLLALSIGAFTRPAVGHLGSPGTGPVESVGFWAVFAVFFPAVTGIMAGLGLSGDLRDPIRSIPRGALTATITGLLVYLFVPICLSRGASEDALLHDPLVWTRIAILGAPLILPGLWGAIFSSAVGSILGAPRTLQALSHDGLMPKFVGRTAKAGGEPVYGLILSTGVAAAAVLLGNLNAVAPVVTMFFLTVYGMVNLVAAVETLSGDPSWRPRIRVPWSICLLGAVACFGVMFLIDARAALGALVIEVLLWIAFARRERSAGFGDIRRDIYEALIRWSLVRLARRPMTARNWRPHVLTFVDHAEKRLDLIRFATWLSQGRGVVTVCELVVGDLASLDVSSDEMEKKIQRLLEREELVAFGEVDVVRDVVSGIVDVSQANGMAGFDSNTIVLGLPRTTGRLTEFLRAVDALERVNKSVLIGRVQPGLIPRGTSPGSSTSGGVVSSGTAT
ncbi:MAG: Na-K-Cl cotransporter [Candidatus Eisenbacteria bacterium]